MTPSCVALIPARSGSKRVRDKNIRRLGAHPLIAYAIVSALESGVFKDVVVSTDSPEYAAIAAHYGASVPFVRPADLAGDTSPDIEWVVHALRHLDEAGKSYDCFSILRPTSPFRTAATIRRAWQAFCAEKGVDSLRAVERCSQHPCKMWRVEGNRMTPVIPLDVSGTPGHSSQYAALPEIHVQNASLEIAWTSVPLVKGTIAGDVVMPFLTEGFEGFDINKPIDFDYARLSIKRGDLELRELSVPSWAE